MDKPKCSKRQLPKQQLGEVGVIPEHLSMLIEKRDALLSNKRKAREFWGAWNQLGEQLSEEDTKLVLIAIHEAGHAVMFWILGEDFDIVTIVPTRYYLGCVREGSKLISGIDFRLPVSKATQEYMDRGMIIYLAGYAAESIYLRPKKPNSNASYWDFQHASDFCAYRFANRKGERAHVNQMVQNATDTIICHWLHVVVLAIELLEKKTISHEGAILLLNRVPRW